MFFHYAIMGVDQVGNLLEGEERNGQRQDDVLDAPAQFQRGIQGAEEKAGVLVIDKQQRIGSRGGR